MSGSTQLPGTRLTAGDRVLTVRFTTNAIVELETGLDKGISEIALALADPASIRIGTLRQMLWAGLLCNDPAPSLEAVGDIIDQVGFAGAGEALGAAFLAAFPEAVEDASPPRPPKGSRKAGTRS